MKLKPGLRAFYTIWPVLQLMVGNIAVKYNHSPKSTPQQLAYIIFISVHCVSLSYQIRKVM